MLRSVVPVNRYEFVRYNGIVFDPLTKEAPVASPLGEKINARRRDLGMSLEQLAALTESSKSYLWELENRDKPNPSLDKVTKIAMALGLSPESLLGSSSPDLAVEADKEFFRKYQDLDDKDKERLRKMVDDWWS